MRRVSQKRARLNRQIQPARDAFRAEFGLCWLCGVEAHDIHEMCRGAHRNQAIQERCTWISTCRRCHDEHLASLAGWPLRHQFALKALRDPYYYDRQRCNEIRSRSPDAITEQEVMIGISEVLRKVRG